MWNCILYVPVTPPSSDPGDTTNDVIQVLSTADLTISLNQGSLFNARNDSISSIYLTLDGKTLNRDFCMDRVADKAKLFFKIKVSVKCISNDVTHHFITQVDPGMFLSLLIPPCRIGCD